MRACRVLLTALAWLPLCFVSHAENEQAAPSAPVSFRLLDADSKAPLSSARVIFAPAWELSESRKRRTSLALNADLRDLRPSLAPGIQPSCATAGADGCFAAVLPDAVCTLTVLHERGIVHLKEGEWDKRGGDLQVKLQRWASLTGLVTCKGKPAPGVVVVLWRDITFVSIGSCFDCFVPPLRHGVAVRADQAGRFTVGRLLPTTTDGSHDAPYELGELITVGPPVTDEELKTTHPAWAGGPGIDRSAVFQIRHGSLSLTAGERQDTSFEATPHSEREVSGRLVWENGSPVRPGDFKSFRSPLGVSLHPEPRRGIYSSTRGTPVGEDGRFHTTLPIAGKWRIEAPELHFYGNGPRFEFDVPEPAEGSGKAIDLGDLVCCRAEQAPTQSVNQKEGPQAAKATFRVAIRVLKEGQAMELSRVQLGAGWALYGWDVFEHPKWRQDNEFILSREGVPEGTWQVQAGHLDEQHWRWFSQVVEVNPPKAGPDADLVLQRGVQVDGQIDPTVPRPVSKGIVRVMVRMPAPSSEKSWPIFWSDWQKLDSSGAFSFRGLPPGDAWIAASCEGWISEKSGRKSPKLRGDPNWATSLSMSWSSQPFRIDAKGTRVNIAMTRAGSIVFRFKKPDGTPLVGAFPHWNPKLEFGPDSQDLQRTKRSLDHLLSKPDETGYRTEAFLGPVDSRYDAAGTIRIENLPPTPIRLALCMEQSRYRWVDQEQLKSDHPFDLYAPFQAKVKPGQVIEKEFVVEAEGDR